MKFLRSKEWWLRRIAKEPDGFIGAGRLPSQSPEQALLLTVARILRANLVNMVPPGMDAYLADDMHALNEALAPFGPSNVTDLHSNTASEPQ
jgi:hypothetical protein